MLLYILSQRFDVHIRIMLRRNNDSRNPNGLAIFVGNRNLRFSVRTQIRQLSTPAQGGQSSGQRVGAADGQRHQLRSFIAGIAKHHALIARTDVAGIQFTALQRIVDAHGDVRRLGVQRAGKKAAFCKAILILGVANAADNVTCTGFIVYISGSGDLTHDMHRAGLNCGFAGAAAFGVLSEQFIQNAVRDLIADFVRMPFGDGFGSEIADAHVVPSFLLDTEMGCRTHHPTARWRVSSFQIPV